MHHFMQAPQHLLHRISNAQRLARGIGQRQRWRIQRRRVKMLGFQLVIQLGLIADHTLAQLRHRSGKGHHRDAAQQVIKDVEVDNQLRLRQRQLVHRRGQRMDKWQNNQAPHQLKQQATQRHAARRRVCRAVVEHRQQPGAQVGANYQAQRHREGDCSRRGQRRRQQHRRQAGVADDREYGAN